MPVERAAAGKAGQSPEAIYAEIGALVSSRLHLPRVYRSLQAILSRRIAARNMYVAIAEGRKLRFPYYSDEADSEDPLDTFPWEGLTGFTIDGGRTVCASREEGVLDRVAIVGKRPSDWLGVPLRGRDGAAMGLLGVQTYEEGARYGDDDIALLEFAAGQLSLAIQLQLYDRELATNRITALVDETADLEGLYAGIHDIVGELIPAAKTCFIIARVDRKAGKFRPVYWRDTQDDLDNIDWPMDRGISSYIYHVSKASFVFETGRTKLPESIVSIGTTPLYWLGVPVWGGSDIIGIVIIQSYRTEEPITREDEATLLALAPQIGQAIGRTELFEHTRHPLP